MKRTFNPFRWGADFYGELIRISLPIILTNLMMSSLHIVDNIMVGSLGDTELASVAQANQLAFILRVTLFGIGGGCAIFSSQYWGIQDIGGIRRTLGISLISALGFSLLAACAAIFAPTAIMRIYTPDPAVIALGASYLQIVGIAYLAMGVSTVFNAANRSTERVRINMVAACSAILVNAFLNWCFIFGNLGFPKMGVQGAALATAIAAFVDVGMLVGWTYYKKYPAAARFSELKIVSWSFARRYYRVALPVMANEGLWSIGTSVYYAIYGHMSTQAVAAMNVFSTVEQMLMATIFGITNATGVMVGKRIGAGNEADAMECSRRMLMASLCLGLLLSAVLYSVRGGIIQFFNISQQAKDAAHAVMGVAAIAMCIRCFNSTNIVGVLRAGGDSIFSMIVDGLGVWCIGVPMAFLGGIVLQQPLPIVFLMIQLEEAVKFVLGMWRFRSKKWIHNLTKI